MEVIFMRIIGILFIVFVTSMILLNRRLTSGENTERMGKIVNCKCKVIGKILDYEAILIGDYYAQGAKFGGYKAKVRYEFEGEEYEVYDLSRPYEEIYKRNEGIELLVDENNPKNCYDKNGLELEIDNKKAEKIIISVSCTLGVLMVIGNINLFFTVLLIVLWPYMTYSFCRMVLYLARDLADYRSKIKKCTKMAKATIVRMEYRFLKMSNKGFNNPPEGVSAVVKYNADGNEVMATSMNKAFFRVYKPGNEVDIFYNPDDISCCYDKIGKKYTVRIFTIFLSSIMFVVFVLAFLLFLLMLVNGKII